MMSNESVSIPIVPMAAPLSDRRSGESSEAADLTDADASMRRLERTLAAVAIGAAVLLGFLR